MTLILLLCAVAPPAVEMPTAVILARSRPEVGRSLKYELRFDELDQIEGNAALDWIRAGIAARRVNYKWTESDWEKMALKGDKFPLKHFKDILARHAEALALADRAARRTGGDWGRPPLTLKSLTDGSAIGLEEVQTFRELANLLRLQGKVQLAERDFDRALTTLRTGLALAQHIGKSNILIHDLVAIAIATIVLDLVSEWSTIPDSPNLYWPLVLLPHPLIDVNHSIRHELNTIYRSVPALREVHERTLTEAEAISIITKVFEAFGAADDEAMPSDWVKTLALRMGMAARADQARKVLLSRGWTEKRLARMPALQIVTLYYLDAYDRTRDDVLRLLSLPVHEGLNELQKLEREARTRAQEDGNPLIPLSLPAISKVRFASGRLEQLILALRAAEALRGGRKVGGAVDPLSGKPIETWLRHEPGRTSIYVPPPLDWPARNGRLMVLPRAGD